MRLFLAIELPGEVRERIGQRIDETRSRLPPARWVPARNLHLTLSFLGEVEESYVGPIEDRLRPVVKPFDRVRLQIRGAGTFPPRRPARVAWVAVQAAEELPELQRQLADAAFAALDREPEERRFHPHVTLARPRRPWRRRAVASFEDAFAGDFGHWRADAVALVRSRLGPDGARHSVLEEFPFRR